MTAGNATASVEKPGLADVVEIFYAPSRVFARRREGQWAIPYLVLVVVGIALFIATKALIQPAFEHTMAAGNAALVASGKYTQAQVDRGASFQSIGLVLAVVGGYAVMPFFIALFVWLIGLIAKVPGASRVAIMVAVFSYFPRLLQAIVGAILAALTPESSLSLGAISLGPAHFVDGSHPVMLALAARFDIFLLWGVVLVAIGLQIAGGATRKQGWLAAFALWGVATLLGVGGAIVRS